MEEVVSRNVVDVVEVRHQMTSNNITGKQSLLDIDFQWRQWCASNRGYYCRISVPGLRRHAAACSRRRGDRIGFPTSRDRLQPAPAIHIVGAWPASTTTASTLRAMSRALDFLNTTFSTCHYCSQPGDTRLCPAVGWSHEARGISTSSRLICRYIW